MQVGWWTHHGKGDTELASLGVQKISPSANTIVEEELRE
jgi:hypothetical protein